MEALKRAREQLGGDAPVLTQSGLPVWEVRATETDEGHNVYVCDLPDDEDDRRAGRTHFDLMAEAGEG
jgi:hypothetical protein